MNNSLFAFENLCSNAVILHALEKTVHNLYKQINENNFEHFDKCFHFTSSEKRKPFLQYFKEKYEQCYMNKTNTS